VRAQPRSPSLPGQGRTFVGLAAADSVGVEDLDAREGLSAGGAEIPYVLIPVYVWAGGLRFSRYV